MSNPYEYRYEDSAPHCAQGYLLPALAKLLPAGKRLRILDLGCGNGNLTRCLAEMGHEVTGVDSSESGIDIARKSASGCYFIRADICELPFDKLEDSFDVVISVEVIEHLLYPGELIKAAARCLRRGGRLILTTPYHGYLKNLVISVLNKWDRHVDVLKKGGHIKFFSAKTLRALLEKENFININFRFTGRLPCLWKSMVSYSLVNKC